jgi:hypothetical protein
MAHGRDGVRWGRVAVVVVALLVINVPYALHEWSRHRAAADGTVVTAAVVGVSPAGGHADVAFRLPEGVDPDRTVRTVTVDRSAGLEAARTKTLEVSVLDGHPGTFHVAGQVRSWTPLIITLVADGLIAVMLLLTWRIGGRLRRPTLVGVAVEDVRSGEDGSLLDRQEDGTYIVNGEVASAGPGSLVLTLRDRDVEIHLRDHDNPVAVGGRARVRAELVG